MQKNGVGREFSGSASSEYHTHGPRFYPHYLKRGDVKEPGVVAVPPCGNSVQDDEAGR